MNGELSITYYSLSTRPSSSVRHSATALATIVVLLGLFTWTASKARVRASLQQLDTVPITIRIDHEKAATIDIVVGSKDAESIVDMTNASDHPILVTLPSNWKQWEVRHVLLSSVLQEQTSDARIAWTIPSSAQVSFIVPGPAAVIDVQHPSRVPLEVRYKRVLLSSGAILEHQQILTAGSLRLPPSS
jgi:hypothetical protein